MSSVGKQSALKNRAACGMYLGKTRVGCCAFTAILGAVRLSRGALRAHPAYRLIRSSYLAP